MATAAVIQRIEALKKKKKMEDPKEAEKAKAAEAKVPLGKKDKAPQTGNTITSLEDVAWAAGVLAPMGSKTIKTAEGASKWDLVVRSPASVVMPLFDNLRGLTGAQNLERMLKSTQIGKIVNSYSHDPNPDISKAAKSLVAEWRTACIAAHGSKSEAKTAGVGKSEATAVAEAKSEAAPKKKAKKRAS